MLKKFEDSERNSINEHYELSNNRIVWEHSQDYQSHNDPQEQFRGNLNDYLLGTSDLLDSTYQIPEQLSKNFEGNNIDASNLSEIDDALVRAKRKSNESCNHDDSCSENVQIRYGNSIKNQKNCDIYEVHLKGFAEQDKNKDSNSGNSVTEVDTAKFDNPTTTVTQNDGQLKHIDGINKSDCRVDGNSIVSESNNDQKLDEIKDILGEKCLNINSPLSRCECKSRNCSVCIDCNKSFPSEKSPHDKSVDEISDVVISTRTHTSASKPCALDSKTSKGNQSEEDSISGTDRFHLTVGKSDNNDLMTKRQNHVNSQSIQKRKHTGKKRAKDYVSESNGVCRINSGMNRSEKSEEWSKVDESVRAIDIELKDEGKMKERIQWHEGFRLPLGADGRQVLLRKLRNVYHQSNEYWDMYLSSHGILFNRMPYATVGDLFKLSHLFNVFDFAVRCSMEYGGDPNNSRGPKKRRKSCYPSAITVTSLQKRSSVPLDNDIEDQNFEKIPKSQMIQDNSINSLNIPLFDRELVENNTDNNINSVGIKTEYSTANNKQNYSLNENQKENLRNRRKLKNTYSFQNYIEESARNNHHKQKLNITGLQNYEIAKEQISQPFIADEVKIGGQRNDMDVEDSVSNVTIHTKNQEIVESSEYEKLSSEFECIEGNKKKNILQKTSMHDSVPNFIWLRRNSSNNKIKRLQLQNSIYKSDPEEGIHNFRENSSNTLVRRAALNDKIRSTESNHSMNLRSNINCVHRNKDKEENNNNEYSTSELLYSSKRGKKVGVINQSEFVTNKAIQTEITYAENDSSLIKDKIHNFVARYTLIYQYLQIIQLSTMQEKLLNFLSKQMSNDARICNKWLLKKSNLEVPFDYSQISRMSMEKKKCSLRMCGSHETNNITSRNLNTFTKPDHKDQRIGHIKVSRESRYPDESDCSINTKNICCDTQLFETRNTPHKKLSTEDMCLLNCRNNQKQTNSNGDKNLKVYRTSDSSETKRLCIGENHYDNYCTKRTRHLDIQCPIDTFPSNKEDISEHIATCFLNCEESLNNWNMFNNDSTLPKKYMRTENSEWAECEKQGCRGCSGIQAN